MHRDGSSTTGGGKMTVHFFPDSTGPDLKCSSAIADFTSPTPYTSIFFTPSTSSQLTSAATTATSQTSATSLALAPNKTTNDLSILMMEHQDLLLRHKKCIMHLQKTFKEAETLRQENTNLRVANRDLNNHLNLIVQAYLHDHYNSILPPGSSSPSTEHLSDTPHSSITESFGGLHINERKWDASGWKDCESPTSVVESGRTGKGVERVSLPKSISVRATGILKDDQPTSVGTTSTPLSRESNRNRSLVPVDGPKKVYVRGGNKKSEAIEVEVYNQGTSKTELCNKWQETGACPYGDHCHFAHGIEELRPVLRHPRYKTEVCRMVLVGDRCPYGHRCHFRHAVTDQEKLMLPLKQD